VVTGVGLVSPVGMGTQANWDALCAGTSGIGPITRFDASAFSTRFAGEVKNFDPLQFIEKKELKKMDIFIQFAIAASQFAIDDARLTIGPELAPRVGVFIGSGIGGFTTIEEQHSAYLEGGPRKISPFFIPSAIINLAAGQVSIRFGAQGPNNSSSTACAAGAHSIGEALHLIRRDAADVMIAGGTEAVITPLAVGAFGNMKALSTRNDDPKAASRPFDQERDGFVMAEGAGVLILEELQHALRRGAPIHAEVLGYGSASDAHHITAPCPDGAGAARCMLSALRDAGISADAIDYINAHATSTPAGDAAETAAIKQVFKANAHTLPISATKSMTGHLLGAAGAVESIFTVLAVREKLLPPTINLKTPDPQCDLDYVPNQARSVAIRTAMSNAFGFGGTNASLVFRSYAR